MGQFDLDWWGNTLLRKTIVDISIILFKKCLGFIFFSRPNHFWRNPIKFCLLATQKDFRKAQIVRPRVFFSTVHFKYFRKKNCLNYEEAIFKSPYYPHFFSTYFYFESSSVSADLALFSSLLLTTCINVAKCHFADATPAHFSHRRFRSKKNLGTYSTWARGGGGKGGIPIG